MSDNLYKFLPLCEGVGLNLHRVVTVSGEDNEQFHAEYFFEPEEVEAVLRAGYKDKTGLKLKWRPSPRTATLNENWVRASIEKLGCEKALTDSIIENIFGPPPIPGGKA